jgi:hypothetical protein
MIRPSIQKEKEKGNARDKGQDIEQLVQRSVLRDLSWRIDQQYKPNHTGRHTPAQREQMRNARQHLAPHARATGLY